MCVCVCVREREDNGRRVNKVVTVHLSVALYYQKIKSCLVTYHAADDPLPVYAADG